MKNLLASFPRVCGLRVKVEFLLLIVRFSPKLHVSGLKRVVNCMSIWIVESPDYIFNCQFTSKKSFSSESIYSCDRVLFAQICLSNLKI